MRTTEHITVDFSDNNHGILRALPETYKHLPLNIHIDHISSDSGAPVTYTTYEQNGNEVLKIGDPNRTVTGTQEYTIEYTMQNVVTFYSDHDELYWNVNGLDWQQPFQTVSATLHLPASLKLSNQAPLCYAGPEGSHDQACAIDAHDNQVDVKTSQSLGARETLSFVVGFQKGYFYAPTFVDYAIGYLKPVLQFLVSFVLLAGAGFIWWLKRGRDAKGTGIVVPEYDAPDGLTPLEVGTLVDFKVDNRDLTATIIDLAIRKYLKIVEKDGTKLLVIKHKTYALELVNKDWSGLKLWEWQLMSGLFGVNGQRPEANLDDLANKLQVEAKNIRRLVPGSLTDAGYFTANPTKYLSMTIGTCIFAGLALIWTTKLSLQGPILWGLVAGAVAFGIFYHFMEARTAKGVAAAEHIKGLKLYLEVAEKDRIAMLQSPGAPYAAKTNAPAQTVELFEKLLPYAIVLGVEKKWAEKFDNLYTTPPSWYVGNYTAFSTGYLVGSLGTSFNSSLTSSFSPPRSSSVSGFGGGGFAGGGGGGGGGGGW